LKGGRLVTKEEALLVFAKWRDDATPLRVVAKLASLHLDSEAVIIGCDWERFTLRLSGEDNFFELDFTECTFNFGLFPKSQGTALVCLRVDGEIFS
jgi:hypothetical protein